MGPLSWCSCVSSSLKQRLVIEPGDVVVTDDNVTIHAQEIEHIRDEEELRSRWMMTTVDVDARAPHWRHLVAEADSLIDG